MRDAEETLFAAHRHACGKLTNAGMSLLALPRTRDMTAPMDGCAAVRLTFSL